MKSMKLIFSILITVVLMSSCGIHSNNSINTNNNITNVELNKKNFRVVERVKGQSTATYVFGMGGIYNKSLVEIAKNQMFENADLSGGAKAIVNVTTESHLTFVLPFFYKKTVTVSAHIVEFTD